MHAVRAPSSCVCVCALSVLGQGRQVAVFQGSVRVRVLLEDRAGRRPVHQPLRSGFLRPRQSRPDAATVELPQGFTRAPLAGAETHSGQGHLLRHDILQAGTKKVG